MSTVNFDIAQKILDHLKNNWTATQIQLPNLDFAPGALDAWISPSMRTADAGRFTITGTIGTGVLLRGILAISIFVKPNTQHGTAKEYIDDLRDLFEEQAVTISGTNKVQFGVLRDREIGPTNINGIKWWQEMAEIPWDYLTA